MGVWKKLLEEPKGRDSTICAGIMLPVVTFDNGFFRVDRSVNCKSN